MIVDTSVWSLFLRRRPGDLAPAEREVVLELRRLVRDGQVLMPGDIRQELLTGIRDDVSFDRLRSYLRAFEDEPVTVEDRERAAQFANTLRKRGIQASHVDVLLCSMAAGTGAPLFTTDSDFAACAASLPVTLHRPLSGS